MPTQGAATVLVYAYGSKSYKSFPTRQGTSSIKLLKAPTLNEAGIAVRNEVGSPQGSILSPVLANLYLHHVLDTWFAWINESQFGNSASIVRYAWLDRYG